MVVFSVSHRWVKALAQGYQHYFKLLFPPLHIPFPRLLKETRALLPATIEGWLCLSKRQVKFTEKYQNTMETAPANHQEL